MNTIDTIAAEVANLVAKFNAFQQKGEGNIDEIKEKLLQLEKKAAAGSEEGRGGRPDPILELAKKFSTDEAIKAVFAGRGPKAGMSFKADSIFETKATITNVSPGSGDTMSQAQRIGIVGTAQPDVDTAILSAIPRGVASSSTIEWIRMTSAKSALLGKPQYDASSPAFREGAAKQEIAPAFSLTKTDVVTVAAWLPVSRQAIDDSGELRGFLTNELFDSVRRELVREVLAGDGADGEMEGLATSGLTTAPPAAVSGEGNIERIRRSIAALEAKGFAVDSIILHPNDWADIELQKSAGGSEEFLAGVPRGANPSSLWNKPVMSHEYQPEGTFVVGALAQSMKLWTRQDAQLLVSDSHGDNFTKNILVMLAELRAAVTIVRPAGLIRGTF